MKKIQLARLLDTIKQEQITSSQVGEIMERIMAKVPNVFHFAVDDSLSYEQMVEAGQYDYVYDIPKGYPATKRGIVWYEATYVSSDDPEHGLSSAEAIKKIVSADEEDPWKPSGAGHILTLGHFFPNDQRQFPIIAPCDEGSTVIGVPGKLALNRYGEQRTCGLACDPEGNVWHPVCQFLAVREIIAV